PVVQLAVQLAGPALQRLVEAQGQRVVVIEREQLLDICDRRRRVEALTVARRESVAKMGHGLGGSGLTQAATQTLVEIISPTAAGLYYIPFNFHVVDFQ